ncbi:hypothetical protein [Xanthobacter sp. KR7-225]|uniref:hypothetical protein n=1 Tax=Xanthobacter sp. KR7-225 TaxID=3156613 RepID=UPI0032B3A779
MPQRLAIVTLTAAVLACGDGRTARGCEAMAAGAPADAAAREALPEVPLAASWGADGALALSDGRALVPAGIALPTALDPQADLVARSRAAATAVLDGRFVVPRARRRDRHGRLVGDARLAGAPSVAASPDASLVLALLAAGAGFADPRGAPSCAAALLAAEAQARRERRGIFQGAGALAPARDEALLARRAGLFALAEGRIRATGATREKVFLNFGARWREDFTIVLPAGDFATILGDGLDPAMLRGTLVEVRGVVRMDGGPAMLVRTRDEIAILDGPLAEDAD